MLLTIDIGNTNMEFGVFEHRTLKANFRLVTNRNITSDEVGLFMTQFFTIQGIQAGQIEDIIITSVVPQVMYSVTNAMRKYIGKKPLVVGENLKVPIENCYGNPKEVGADRLVNAYIAHQKYGGALIVVDFGTATTFDAVSETGAYEGGAIYPGVKISMDALTQHAAKLPRIELSKPKQAIGKDTVESMQAGIIFGYVGAVRNIISLLRKELGIDAKVIATGGLSKLIGQQAGIFDVVDQSLTLEGLMMLYYNSRGEKNEQQ